MELVFLSFGKIRMHVIKSYFLTTPYKYGFFSFQQNEFGYVFPQQQRNQRAGDFFSNQKILSRMQLSDRHEITLCSN